MKQFYLTAAQAKRLGGLYRQERQGAKVPPPRPPFSTGTTILLVKLKSDLADTDDPMEPTECEAEVYRGAGDKFGIHTIDGENETITVVNRTETSYEQDAIVFVIRPCGEYWPLMGGGGGVAIGVLQAGSAISGRAGNTPGSGPVLLEKYQDGSISATDKTVTVLNNLTGSIDTQFLDEDPVDVYVSLMKYKGRWWVIAADCANEVEDDGGEGE